MPDRFCPSGEGAKAALFVPSGDMACGVPPGSCCTYSRAPCPDSYAEKAKRLPSGNQRALILFMELLGKDWILPARVGNRTKSANESGKFANAQLPSGENASPL